MTTKLSARLEVPACEETSERIPLVRRRATDALDPHAPPGTPNSSLTMARSCWETNGATPMISRPHMVVNARRTARYHLSPGLVEDILHARQRRGNSMEVGSSMKRPRSKSLGTEYDRAVAAVAPLPMAFLDQSPQPPEPPSAPEPRRIAVETEVPKETEEPPQSAWISTMYGVVNAFIVLPVLMSFASIIYRDPFFAPYMPILVKLTLVSGIVHQLCFSAFSSLPFAIGQVQDAGLIFLSNMATTLVHFGQSHDDSAERILATVTVSLGLGTAILGVGLVLVGRLQLAGYVRMLPTCIVGGYLAYIGWFCGLAGVSLMANSAAASANENGDEETEGSSRHSVYCLQRVGPGLVGGMLLYALVRKYRHMAVLPACIASMLGLFYVIVWWRGVSIEQVTREGWIRTMDESPPLSQTWKYLRLDQVHWAGLPRLLGAELGMVAIVALSSSLDVAAIELELNEPLDYNHELVTVGVSNIVSGMTGGYTGSYIFSQSIFSLRAGIRSRLAGFVLALCQIMVLLLPFPVLKYVPNFFFGSLLSMICFDLMYEWLWDVRKTIQTSEYLLSWATFLLIQALNVEMGVLGGVILYLLCWKAGINVGDVRMVKRQVDEISSAAGEYGAIQ